MNYCVCLEPFYTYLYLFLICTFIINLQTKIFYKQKIVAFNLLAI